MNRINHKWRIVDKQRVHGFMRHYDYVYILEDLNDEYREEWKTDEGKLIIGDHISIDGAVGAVMARASIIKKEQIS